MSRLLYEFLYQQLMWLFCRQILLIEWMILLDDERVYSNCVAYRWNVSSVNFLADRTNDRASATVLRPSSAVVCLWLNGTS